MTTGASLKVLLLRCVSGIASVSSLSERTKQEKDEVQKPLFVLGAIAPVFPVTWQILSRDE